MTVDLFYFKTKMEGLSKDPMKLIQVYQTLIRPKLAFVPFYNKIKCGPCEFVAKEMCKQITFMLQVHPFFCDRKTRCEWLNWAVPSRVTWLKDGRGWGCDVKVNGMFYLFKPIMGSPALVISRSEYQDITQENPPIAIFDRPGIVNLRTLADEKARTSYVKHIGNLSRLFLETIQKDQEKRDRAERLRQAREASEYFLKQEQRKRRKATLEEENRRLRQRLETYEPGKWIDVDE